MSIKEPEEVPGTGIEMYSAAKWSRTTIADGKWLQNNTLNPLYENELILASGIHDTSASIVSKVTDVSGRLHNEIMFVSGAHDLLREETEAASGTLQGEIDTINAGSDVIDVVNDLQTLSAYHSWTTQNDVIKVLNDSAHYDEQTYYRWTGEDTMDPSSAANLWEFVGGVSPYYSKSEINEYSAATLQYMNGQLEAASAYVLTASGNLDQKIDNKYTDLYGRISSSSAALDQKIDNKYTDIYETVQSVSGTLDQKINNTSSSLSNAISGSSAILDQKIDDKYSDVYETVQSVSGTLSSEIGFVSGRVDSSAASLNSKINTVSGMFDSSASHLASDISYVSGQLDYSAALLNSKMLGVRSEVRSGSNNIHVTSADVSDRKIFTVSADYYQSKGAAMGYQDVSGTIIVNNTTMNLEATNSGYGYREVTLRPVVLVPDPVTWDGTHGVTSALENKSYEYLVVNIDREPRSDIHVQVELRKVQSGSPYEVIDIYSEDIGVDGVRDGKHYPLDPATRFVTYHYISNNISGSGYFVSKLYVYSCYRDRVYGKHQLAWLGDLETSASQIENDLNDTRDYLYDLIESTSGKVELASTKYISVTNQEKPDGTISYSASLIPSKFYSKTSSLVSVSEDSNGIYVSGASNLANVQSDWDVTNSASDAYIKNKPTYSYYSNPNGTVTNYAYHWTTDALGNQRLEGPDNSWNGMLVPDVGTTNSGRYLRVKTSEDSLEWGNISPTEILPSYGPSTSGSVLSVNGNGGLAWNNNYKLKNSYDQNFTTSQQIIRSDSNYCYLYIKNNDRGVALGVTSTGNIRLNEVDSVNGTVDKIIYTNTNDSNYYFNGIANKASIADLSKSTDTTNGDTLKIGTGTGQRVDNAGNAYKWNGIKLSRGTFSTENDTISIV